MPNVSAFFYHDEKTAHLNAGTLTRVPIAVLDWMHQYRLHQELAPTKAIFEAASCIWRAQKEMARRLSVDANDLFLRSSITDAVNHILFALPNTIKTCAYTSLEYGAISNALKVFAAHRGAQIHQIDFSVDVCDDEWLACLENKLVGVDLLLVSHVATGTGRILPLEKIAKVAKRTATTLLVDGAHAAGALALDISALGVDFYAGNFHKWFLGPKGTGFGWTHPKWREKLNWPFGGWASFQKPAHYEGFEGSAEAARRVFPGTIDTASFAALLQIGQFWDTWGDEALRGRQKALLSRAMALAEDFGWKPVDTVGVRGPLVSYKLPEKWSSISSVQLANRLYFEAGVQVALPQVQGQKVLRLSPGVYSSEEEIDIGMKRLVEFL